MAMSVFILGKPSGRGTSNVHVKIVQRFDGEGKYKLNTCHEGSSVDTSGSIAFNSVINLLGL